MPESVKSVFEIGNTFRNVGTASKCTGKGHFGNYCKAKNDTLRCAAFSDEVSA